jgi:hypothetical protein
MNDDVKSMTSDTEDPDTRQETRPMALALALQLQERVRATLLFRRVCTALGLTESTATTALAELFVAHDLTPTTIDESRLWAMRTGLFEVANQVLPLEQREAAQNRLQILMLEIAPG